MSFVSPERLVQIEIYVSSLKDSLAYYSQVFGWEPVPAYIHGVCVMDVKGAQLGVSLVPLESSGGESKAAQQRLTLYFAVENEVELEHMIKSSESYTGKTIRFERKMPSYGLVRHIADPDGNRFGLFLKATPKS